MWTSGRMPVGSQNPQFPSRGEAGLVENLARSQAVFLKRKTVL